MGIFFTKPEKTYPCCCFYTNDEHVVNPDNATHVSYRRRAVWVPYGS